MEVAFCIDPPNRQLISEADLEDRLNELRQQLPEDENVMGGLILSDPSTAHEVEIGDDLESLVPKLCLLAIPELASGKDIELELYVYEERIRLKNLGASIEVSGDRINKATFPRGPLLIGLVACAERFMEFLLKLRNNDDETRTQMQRWQGWIQQAREELAKLT